jgi:hypothetical protein
VAGVLGAGAVGYDDYQRIANYDSAILYSFVAPPSASTLESSVIPVLRWSYLEGILAPNTNPSLLTFTWTADLAGLSTIGVRTFVISPLVTNPMQFRLSNLGPYVQVQQSPIGGLNWGCSGQMFGGNRQSLLEAIPQNNVVISQQAAAVGANVTQTIYPTDYYAGPMSVWVLPQMASSTVTLVYVSPTVLLPIVQVGMGGTNSENNFTLVVPLGAWAIQFSNLTAAASTYYMVATTSSTGAI